MALQQWVISVKGGIVDPDSSLTLQYTGAISSKCNKKSYHRGETAHCSRLQHLVVRAFLAVNIVAHLIQLVLHVAELI